MKICVVGSGAIGGSLAVWLAHADNEVTVVARGENLRAIRDRGLRLIDQSGAHALSARVRAVETPAEAGPHDAVILAVKANQLAPISDALECLFHDDSMLVPMQNGIPWWYFQRHGGELEGRVVHAVDPDGRLARAVDPARIVGCVVYPAAELAAPGVIRHVEGTRFPLGELDGSASDRVAALARTFEAAGLKAPVLADIRAEIWLKLWGNLCFNPISALTHATLAEICEFPQSRALARNMMLEAEAIANRLGVQFRVGIDRRIAGAERVGAHKTSMLQDIETGREPEIDALLGSVIELGRLTATPTPALDTVYACVKLLTKVMVQQGYGVRGQRAAAPTKNAAPPRGEVLPVAG